MAKITFRSYDIEEHFVGNGGGSFEGVLAQIAQLNYPDRDVLLPGDCRIRLFRHERPQDGNRVFGEFIRIRDTNFPMIVHDQGVGRIPVPDEGNNIGQGAVFCYMIAERRLYLQYDIRIVPDTRAMSYVSRFSNSVSFSANVRMRDNVWAQLQRGMVRKVMIRVASPNNFGALDDGGGLKSNFNAMGQAYDAPSIYLEISVGRVRDAELGGGIRQQLEILCNNGHEENLEVKSVKAQVKEDGIESEIIDLIDDVFSTQQDIVLPKNDPGPNYAIRKRLLIDLIDRNAFEV